MRYIMSLVCEQLNPHAYKTYLLRVEWSSEVVFIDPRSLSMSLIGWNQK